MLYSCGKEESIRFEDIATQDILTVYDDAAMKSSELLSIIINKAIELFSAGVDTNSVKYPIFERLLSLDITDECGNDISIFELSREQRTALIESLTCNHSEMLKEKMLFSPKSYEYVKRQNDILETLLSESSASTKATSGYQFFDELTKRTDELSEQWVNVPIVTKNSSSKNKDTVTMNSLNKDLIEYLKIFSDKTESCDILITLPNPDNPLALINFGNNNNNCIFGHAGIITNDKKIDDYLSEFKEQDIETIDGVQYYKPYTDGTIYNTVYDKTLKKITLITQTCSKTLDILKYTESINNNKLDNLYIYKKQSSTESWKTTIKNIINEKNRQLVNGLYSEKQAIEEFDGKIIECFFAVTTIDQDKTLTTQSYTTDNYKYGIPYSTITDMVKTQNILSRKIHHTIYKPSNVAVKKYLYSHHLTECINNGFGVQTAPYKFWFDNQCDWYLLIIGHNKIVYNNKTKKYETRWTNLSDKEKEKIIQIVKKQLGKRYVSEFEFPFAKWCVPNKYTCTSLIWYATKEATGINMSPWYSTVVSPTDIYLSNNTAIKQKITPEQNWFKTE